MLVSSLGKLCLPLQLSVLAIPEDTSLLPGVAAVVALLISAWRWPSLRPHFAFATLAYLVSMLPSLPATRTLILESRLYFPLVPLIGLVGGIAQTSLNRSPRGGALGTALVALFAWRTHGYVNDFRDRQSFTSAAVRESPHSALAHRNLGVYYHLEQRIGDAEREYETALRLDPMQAVVHNNLGVIHMAQAKLADAERELRAELATIPGYADAEHNLAMILRATGRVAEAVRHWQGSLAHNSGDLTALQALTDYFEPRDPTQAEYYRTRLEAERAAR